MLLATRISAVLFFTILLLFGSSSNILLLVAFISGRKIFNAIPFYFIAYQMIICDFCIYIAQALIVIPSLLLNPKMANEYASSKYYSLLASFDSIGSYGSLHFTALIACNRFVVFAPFKLTSIFANRRILLILILFIWLFSFVLSLIEYFICPKSFNAEGIYLYYDCGRNSTSLVLKEIFGNFVRIWGYLLPAVMFVCYIYIFICMKKMRKPVSLSVPSSSPQRSKIQESMQHTSGRKSMQIIPINQRMHKMDPETSIIVQASIICGFLELQTLIFFLFPIFSDYLPNGYGIYLNIFQNGVVIMANSMSPLIFYGFNAEIRRRVRHIFGYLKIRRVSMVRTTA